MAMTSSESSSQTSGTSFNTTKGDKYTGQVLPMFYAAAGYDKKAAKKAAKIQSKMDKLQWKLDQGKLNQSAYEQKMSKLEAKQAQPGKVSPGQVGLQQMLENNPMEFYPDPTYVQMDPATIAAIEARIQQAQQPGGMADVGQGYVSDVLSGRYLGEQNPYLQGMYQHAASGVTSDYLQTVLPQLEARFAGAGGKGGAYQAMLSASNQGLADELSGLAQNLYGGAYAQERDLMSKAASMAPMMQQMGYYDVDELERAGRAREDFEKIKLQDLIDRWNWDQDAGFRELRRMTGGISDLPMAAGTGETDYAMRTVGGGQEFHPSIPDTTPPQWERILMGII